MTEAELAVVAAQIDYDAATVRYATASETYSDAKAELELMKDVLKYKIAHDTDGIERTSVAHELSGETLNTAIRTIGPYRVRIKESVSSGFDLNGLREQLQSLIAQVTAEGDSQVSRRDQLREMLQMLDSHRTYSKRESFEISSI